MKEDFLHYIWRFKLLDCFNLRTTCNKSIEIINFGIYTKGQGPDFFNALIKIDSQLWAGNIEMHVKASDWYVHQHQNDVNYDNVILHVVWEHDVDVFYPDNKPIPVLLLKNYVSPNLLNKYAQFFSQNKFIPCQNQIHTVPNHIWSFFKERLFLERLESKSKNIFDLKDITQSNWEQITFITLCKNFGLHTNSNLFEQMALKIPYSVFCKVKSNLLSLESLFFGMLNLLPKEVTCEYEYKLLEEFNYLKYKFNLEPLLVTPTFYKHRPDNFPTIRLAQLAKLFYEKNNIFELIVSSQNFDNFYTAFQVQPSAYWQTHYNFNSGSHNKSKKISKAFVQLLIINAIVPLLYCYNKEINKLNIDELIRIIEFLPPEKNNIIFFFDKLHVPIQSAFDSQVLLQLKNNYCDALQCLHCSVGKYLIK